MFGKKVKTKKNIISENNKDKIVKFNKPKIITFNLNKKTTDELTKGNYDFYFGSLGKEVKIKNIQVNTGWFCLLNYDFPDNSHEYDIFIFDLCNREQIDYKPEEHIKENIKTNKDINLYCNYPKSIFDPRPYSGRIFSEILDDISNRKSIVIIFCSEFEVIEYDLAERYGSQANIIDTQKYSNYSFSPIGMSFGNNKSGKIFNYDIKNYELKKIFNKYLIESEYYITFKEITISTGFNQFKEDKNFIPLIYNNDNEIVSYLYFNKEQLFFYFPNIHNKSDFINDLLNNYLPDIYPELFPNSIRNQWLNEQEFYLPNYKKLIEKKENLTKEYNKNIKLINNEIENNKQKFSFLHDIITSSGDNLVNAVIKYLCFLGYSNIKNMDEEKDNDKDKEEDIQIILEDKLIIIEVKGIGGTSTDSDCLQISKIRHRRCKERGDFNVHAIYLVNHQKHLPANKRKMPPFTINQIQDAINDERSLLTTWQFFQIYNLIKVGFITKNEIKKCFFKYGYIDFINELFQEIGKVTEVFDNGMIIILELNNISLNNNDLLLVKKNGFLYTVKIESLQLNKKNVKIVNNGVVGIKVNKIIKKNSIIFKKK